MAKWADYLISAVSYNSNHFHIDKVMAHVDNDTAVGDGEIYFRQSIIDAINKGTTFVTIYKNGNGQYNKGQKVFVINVNGVGYLKTVDNGVAADNLENLPEF